MRVLHIASELFPVVRTGGLGDVVAALPAAQRTTGQDARVLLPGYPALMAALSDVETVAHLGPVFGVQQVDLVLGALRNGTSALPVYAIAAPSLYDRPGNPYQAPDGADWFDNATRFGVLSFVGARLAEGRGDPAWRADILHAHDWHAGLAPAYLRFDPQPDPPGSVFTIHNLAYQGQFPLSLAEYLGIPGWARWFNGVEFWGALSFMKAGLVFADRITTVSPGYAREIATPAFGFSLDGIIASRGADVRGVLNGVDEEHWDPARDPLLTSPFTVDTVETARPANRTALARHFGIAEPDGPVFGVVSRLTWQKGLDLLLGALPTLLATGGSLVLVGAGEPGLEAAFRDAAAANPERIGAILRYDDTLAHQIMAGADIVLVPSRFEPCGLTQLYALRYGAVPLVRRTGGLGDTVTDYGDPEGTGIMFDGADSGSLSEAIWRAGLLYRDPSNWRAVRERGMRQSFSWRDSARQYQLLYSALRPVP